MTYDFSHLDAHDARTAWLKDHMVRSRHAGMPSEVSIEIPDVARLRIFRVGRRWEYVMHRPTDRPVLRDAGIRFEIDGDREWDVFRTRESAIGHIAIRYRREIDALLEAD